MYNQTEREKAIPALAEVFRTHGYEGASLALISQATGLGKGSLYHAFPGGKEEMARAVLAHIDAWFEANVFRPLRNDEPSAAIAAMFEALNTYFHSGGRVCLVGVFALSDTRDRFAESIRAYFIEWMSALADALTKLGLETSEACATSEAILGGIQGALVMARATNDPECFERAMSRLKPASYGPR